MTTLKKCMIAIALTVTFAVPAGAEEGVYGDIYLGGLARDVEWPLNEPGETNVMVCNVNGPEGYLSVRMGPGTDHAEMRSFNRLAILVVDTREWYGHWIRVVEGMRSHTADGIPQNFKPLPVTGWAHDGYLCSFQD
ncbi:MAG: hypothetical protein ACI82I_000942 [Gammaproteobacteria bacterium]|jgi:hypothetical protein